MENSRFSLIDYACTYYESYCEIHIEIIHLLKINICFLNIKMIRKRFIFSFFSLHNSAVLGDLLLYNSTIIKKKNVCFHLLRYYLSYFFWKEGKFDDFSKNNFVLWSAYFFTCFHPCTNSANSSIINSLTLSFIPLFTKYLLCNGILTALLDWHNWQ